MILSASAVAATLDVTTSSDAVDDASCLPGNCSLRQAVNLANLDSADDRITVPAGTYTLNAAFGELPIVLGSITLDGAGQGLTILSGGGATGVLGIALFGSASINDLTITNGSNHTGGGIAFESDTASTLTNVTVTDNTAPASGAESGGGGGIYQLTGSVSVVNSTISNNRALGSATAPAGGGGGGILSSGQLNITNSTIANNTATAAGSASGGVGGGIFGLLSETTLTASTLSDNVAEAGSLSGGSGGAMSYSVSAAALLNSTVSGNTAAGSGSIAGRGGGVQSSDSLLGFTSSTIAANVAGGSSGAGGNIQAGTDLIGYTNSIISGGGAATGSNCQTSALVIPQGRNLESTDQCGLGTYDLKNFDPQLAALAANGGPTQTMALPATSPAVDAALSCPPPSADQRGTTRPQGSACDIGAFELVPTAVAVPEISALKLSPKTFAPRASGGSVVAKRKRLPTSTRVRYSLNEAATVTFTVQRQVKGHKAGKRCSKTRKRGRRCTIYRDITGAFTQPGQQGANSFKFTGRIGGNRLTPGAYRLVGKPATVNNPGVAQPATFRIARPYGVR